VTSTWWDAAVGRSHALVRTFSTDDLEGYDALVGDVASVDVVPEPLVAGLFSTLLGVHLPGPGTNYLKQALRVVAPARPGEPLEASVEVVRVVPDKRLVYLATRCRGADGRLVADGEALVLAGGVPAP
jgi:acyl dehydratase